MKATTIFKKTASKLFLITLSFTLATACGDAKKDDTKEPVTETQQEKSYELVSLLDRTEGLASQEFEDLKERFNQHKAAYNKDHSDFQSLLKLAEIYIYEARVSGEHPYYYSAANDALDEMIKNKNTLTEDEYFTALFYKSTVQLSQHHFQDALVTAQEAKAINDKNAGIYGVLVDANVEMGNYDAAVEMCDTMMLIRPDLRSYSRTSYLREIYGDLDGSKEAMKMAINAGAPYSEYKCWSIVTMGKIHESHGDLDSALAYYEFAITERENYPFGLAGMASVYAKQGKTDQAKKMLKSAIEIIPEIGFHIDMAQLLKEEGNMEAYNAKIAEIEEMFQEDIASGHNMNLEYAAFLLAFKNDAKAALAKAEMELEERKNNIDVNKNLAVINYKLGNQKAAMDHLEIALKTNKKDADLICLQGLLKEDTKLIAQSFKMNPYQNHVLVAEAKQKLK